MKHITYAEKSLLVGDEAADLTLEYGAALATSGQADTINLRAIGADGDEVVATLLLDPGSNLMAETTRSSLDEPDNAEAVTYMRARLGLISSPRIALPDDEPFVERYDDQVELPHVE